MSLRKREKFEKEDPNIIPHENIIIRKGDTSESNSESDHDDHKKLTFFYWICMIAVGILLFDLATRLQASCDYENDFLYCLLRIEKSENPMDITFNDTLARNHLIAISKLGYRPAGSIANEIHTPTYLLNYFEKLKSLYIGKDHSNIEMIIDEQLAHLNSFNMKFFGNDVTSIYEQIKNIVVRLHDTNSDGRGQNSPAVLFNCHYDSFFGGVGASDDLASCVVLLETMHSILKNQPISLKFDLIFLFNGAEENMLQGSHAFVSQHKLAKDVKLFVNLEAAGSGGRQLVFQTSKNNPWLISELALVFRQPLANIIAQEIFSADLIPSDTDFRVFRDYSRLPGIDIAFVANGYVYHTKYDTEDRIPQTCLRNTGNNILQLAIKLANSENIAIYPEDEKFVKDTILTSQRIIYFDLMGLALVSYSELLGVLINFCLCIVSVGLVLWYSQFDDNRYFTNIFKTVISQLIWVFTNLILAILLGYLVHRFGCRMSWYSIRYHIVGLYLVPLVWYFFIYHQFISRFVCRFQSSQKAFQYHICSSLIILSLLTFVLTSVRLLSVYVVAIWLFFFILNIFLREILQKFNLLKFSFNYVHFIRDTLSLSIPFGYFFYLIFMLYDVFIPIFGRAGPTYPDIIISGLTALILIIPGLVLSGTVYLTNKNTKKCMTFLLLHFAISYYIFLHCTQFGFPYNQSEIMPRKQRIIIDHVTRNIRNDLGQTKISESGIWMLSLDANQLVHLKSQLQEVIHEPMQDVFCELRPYCGYPMLYPMAKIVDNSLWLPQPPHQLNPTASIIILSKVTHISGMVNVTMQISGPSRFEIYIMTPCSMRITSWSLGPDAPVPVNMPHRNQNYRHYFILYAYGKRPAKPLKLWIMFMPKIDPLNDFPKNSPENQIEVALGAHYLTTQTSEIEAMVHLMPAWVVPTTLASSYEHLVVDFDQNLSYVQ